MSRGNMKIKLLNIDNLQESELENIDIVADSLSNHKDLIANVIKWQLANRRGFSTAKTKTRGEIAYIGKKPFNQKGRGSARQSSLKNAQLIENKKTITPKKKKKKNKKKKKMVKKALSLVLKDKFVNNKVYVLDGLDKIEISTNKLNKKFVTKGFIQPIVVYQENFDNFSKSIRNLKDVKYLNVNALNVYDLLNYDFLLLDKNSYDKIIKEVL